jgi:tetratricopeptide (TPR) repeat protein
MTRVTCVGVAALIVAAAVGLAAAPQLTERQHEQAARHFRAGMQALASERYDVAEQEFRGAVKEDPLYDAAFYGLGQVYMATKRYEHALQAYLDSRAAFREATANEALESAASDRRLRDQIQALKDYVRNMERQVAASRAPAVQQAIDRNNDQIRQLEMRVGRKAGQAPPPVPAGLSMALGSAYFRLNKLEDAEREYKAAIQVNPRFGEAHNNLAVVYLMTGRLDEAERSVAAAKAAGFQVHPQLERDIKSRRSGS